MEATHIPVVVAGDEDGDVLVASTLDRIGVVVDPHSGLRTVPREWLSPACISITPWSTFPVKPDA
jgi:hypothetical protein